VTSRARMVRGGGRRASLASAAAVAVLVLWQLLAVAAPASAHAVLVSSDPQDGSRVTSAPTRVTFTFDEAVQLPTDGTAAVSDKGGAAGRGAAMLGPGGHEVIVPLRADLPDGAYTVSYRVVSADGHIVTGAIRFGVNADPTVAPDIAPATVDPLQVIAGVAQGAVYLGVSIAGGTVLALLVLWPRTRQGRTAATLRWSGWVLVACGTLVRLFIAGPAAAGSGWPGIVRLDGFATTLHEAGGVAGLVRVALLLALVPWMTRPRRGARGQRALAAALTVGVLVTIAVDGHAVGASDWWLAVPATVVHLAAMSMWIGGLCALVTLVLPTISGAAPDLTSMRRWSRVAFSSVAALIISGEYLAWRQIDPVESITATAYGVTLLVKLAVVAVALVLAVISHRRLIRRAAPDGSIERRRAKRLVGIEAAATIVVVIVTTLLVSLPPARTTYGPETTVTAPVGTASAVITIDPTHTGPQRISVRLESASGADVEPKAVSGTIGTDSVSGVSLTFTRHSSGGWTSAAIAPIAGTWTLQLTVDLGDAGTYATSARYQVWG